MGLKKLLAILKKYKQYHKDFHIKPIVVCEVEDTDYMFAFLPTVVWQPWVFRRNHAHVVDIWWLNLHIYIGCWEEKKHDQT